MDIIDHRATDDYSPYDRPHRVMVEQGEALLLPTGHDAKIVALLMTLVEVTNDALIHDGGSNDERFTDLYATALDKLHIHYNEDG